MSLTALPLSQVPQHALWLALAAALPWIFAPLVTLARVIRSRKLADESPDAPRDAPLVSIIIPARNEGKNIARCLQAVLTSTYPQFEVIVVDDHSTDETGRIARAIAATDVRLRVLDNPDLPPDWFGKQWACQNGANAAGGRVLIFVDADTCIAPDLVTRSVNGMQRMGADLYSVIGRQEMHSFWEKLLQPQMFTMLATRYGGTESVNQSEHVWDKIANGQYLMIRADAYRAMHGHALVRTFVAEDLMLAQRYFAAGRVTGIVVGWDQLSTRMYTSLRELIDGWRKNAYAAGREAIPPGRIGQCMFPIILVTMPLMELAPVATLLILSMLGVSGVTPLILWATVTTLVLLVWWTFVYWTNQQRLMYALCFPLGAAILLYIFMTAIARGDRVRWKGRNYLSAPNAGKHELSELRHRT